MIIALLLFKNSLCDENYEDQKDEKDLDVVKDSDEKISFDLNQFLDEIDDFECN